MHDILAHDHPGTVDPRNPGFARTLRAGLQQALQRTSKTTDRGGWYWAMKEFAAGFDDAHLQVIPEENAPALPLRWPGFLAAYRGGAVTVGYRDSTAPDAPPVGARLVDCDGAPPARLLATRVGAFVGQWSLEGQREKFGQWLFEDRANP